MTHIANHVPLRDWLLTFWQTAVKVACEQQNNVIATCEKHEWNGERLVQWLDALFFARKHGRASIQQTMLLQHEQIILQQLEMAGRDRHQQTLASLMALFSSAATRGLSSEEEDRDRDDGDDTTPTICTAAHAAKHTEAAKNATAALQQLSCEREAMFLLITANHAADLYLNVAFGVLLQSSHEASQQTTIGVSYDANARFVLERVQLVHGSVVNAKRCIATCLAQKKCKKDAKCRHLSECRRRDAVWLLLSFVSQNDSRERRQLHFDVAAVRYGIKTCVGDGDGLPLPLHCGFVPLIETVTYRHFETEGWPLAGRERYKQASWQQIMSFSANDTHYVIDKVQPVVGMLAHYNSVCACQASYPFVAPRLEFAAQLYDKIKRISGVPGREKEAISLIGQLKKHRLTRERAEKAIFELDALRAARSEAICVQSLLQQLRECSKSRTT